MLGLSACHVFIRLFDWVCTYQRILWDRAGASEYSLKKLYVLFISHCISVSWDLGVSGSGFLHWLQPSCVPV